MTVPIVFLSSSIRLGNFPRSTASSRCSSKLGYQNVEPYGGLFAEPGGAARGVEEIQARHADRAYRHRAATRRRRGRRQDREGFRHQGGHRSGRPAGRADAAAPPAGTSSARSSPATRRSSPRTASDFAWHNHNFEFAKLPDGSYPLDHIFAAAPGLHWQADIGWIQWAGESAADWIDKYKDRVTALHVKDLAPKGENAEEDGQADVGHGVLDWKKLMPVDQGAGRQVPGDGARQPERLRALRPSVVQNSFRLVGRPPWTRSALELSAAAISPRST